MSAIIALWLRDIRGYIRQPLDLALSLIPFVLLLFVLGAGIGHAFRASGEGSYFQFLVPGIVTMTVLYVAAWSGMSLLFDRQSGFIKLLLVAPVPRLFIVSGQILGMSTVATLHGTIIIVVSMLAGYRPVHIGSIPLALLFMALTAVIFTSLGVTIGAVLKDATDFKVATTFVVWPLFFFSGGLYPLDNLPPLLALLSHLDPIAYAVDGLRGALSGSSRFGLRHDGLYLVLLVLPSFILSRWRFTRIEV
jgi:ABC-2 type transport system permease protein